MNSYALLFIFSGLVLAAAVGGVAGFVSGSSRVEGVYWGASYARAQQQAADYAAEYAARPLSQRTLTPIHLSRHA